MPVFKLHSFTQWNSSNGILKEEEEKIAPKTK